MSGIFENIFKDILKNTSWTPPTDIAKGAEPKISDKIGGDGGNYEFGGATPSHGFLCPKGAYITHIDGGWKKNGWDAMNLYRFTCSDGWASRAAGSGGGGAWGADDAKGFLGVHNNSGPDVLRSATFLGASGRTFPVGEAKNGTLNNFDCPHGQKLVGIKGQVGSSNTGVLYHVYYMCDWPVDCTSTGVPKNTWNEDCDKFGLVGDPSTAGAIFTARRAYCNADATVNDSKCDTFCKTWPDSCQTRKNCGLTGLTGANCTAANVDSMTQQCLQKGFITGGLGQNTTRACTQSSLDDINAECDAYGIPRGEKCTAAAVMVEKTNAATKAASDKVIAAQAELQAKQANQLADISKSFTEAMNAPVLVSATASPTPATATQTSSASKTSNTTSPNWMLIGGFGSAALCCLLIVCCCLIFMMPGNGGKSK